MDLLDGERKIARGALVFGGVFLLSGLPGGEYVVQAGVVHEGLYFRGRATSAVPAENVRIVLDGEGETLNELNEEYRFFSVRMGGSFPTSICASSAGRIPRILVSRPPCTRIADS